MSAITYTLCAITALACAWLLLRAYRQSRERLLLWSGLCFTGLFIANMLLIADRIFIPDYDLATLRLCASLASLLPLLYGLVWEDD
ncbi:DUF5985 family protein [Pseudoduganella sp. UC29_106]|uniref:DUF5985 family protein n=1 Tax=Pseudoduganella sp. UC29_106 TaxID=3374553 RepID=UPI003757C104